MIIYSNFFNLMTGKLKLTDNHTCAKKQHLRRRQNLLTSQLSSKSHIQRLSFLALHS